VHRGDQQVDQAVSHFPLPLSQQRRQQGDLRLRRRRHPAAQVRRELDRHPATTFGATSANRHGGSPISLIAWSLRISVSIDSRLTFPGTGSGP
jgi:hypothetical protein